MILKCPGQDARNLTVESVHCPSCGYAVEIFSDETGVRCPECKNLACRDRLPSCVDWCCRARECLGEGKWLKLKNGGK